MAPKFGVTNTAKIEKVQIKFNKRYACLHQNTANYFVLSECRRYSLAENFMTQCVKYWARLTQMRDNRYPKQCYNMLRSLALAGKNNWASISVYFCIGMVLGICEELILLGMLQDLLIYLGSVRLIVFTQ